MGASDFLVVILAILLPPVAVFIRRGCGAQLLINILLTLCGHIPGAIHALYLVLHDRERRIRSQQTNSQAMYGAPAQPAYGDNKIQQQPYGQQAQQTQPMYFDQPREMAPEPMPPTYPDQSQMRGEKQEYAPVANGALSTKEI
jgi:uncharacterized membrane protein YqaE (UPF0057 family)